MIKGSATSAGTVAYRTALADTKRNGHFREWRGLALSSVGIGTYLGPDDDATDALYAAAIERALVSGINVIDSAVNYRRQRSERAVGRALTGTKGFSRNELIVCTKGGYLPFDGAPPRDVRSYIEETFVKPGIAAFEDFVGGSHCMTPRYLEDQIERSRTNLDLETIDIYYLHNPETQLGEISRPVFMRRLRAAFEFLESTARDRRIGVYGTATWSGYRQPPSARDFLSLPDLVALAEEVGGPEHHFRVVQLPYNLAMTEAFTLPNQPGGSEPVPLLEAARRLRHDLGVHLSGPARAQPSARAVPDSAGPRYRRPAGAAVRAIHARRGHGSRGDEVGSSCRRGGRPRQDRARALVGVPEALRVRVSVFPWAKPLEIPPGLG